MEELGATAHGRRGTAVAAVLASGLLMAGALPVVVPAVSLRPLDPRGWLELLAWGALAPALVALSRSRRVGAAAGLGLLCGLVYFGLALHWIGHALITFGGRSLVFTVGVVGLLVLILAAHWAVAFGAAALVRQRLGWPLWAHLPFTWGALELVRAHLFTGFPWANLGYTQARTAPIAQLAAVGGVHAIAALVVLVNAALAEAWIAVRARRGLPWPALGVAGALVAAALLHGGWRLAALRAELAAAPTMRVGLVQPNIDQATKNRYHGLGRYILGRLLPPTLEAEAAGAELVAWPETAYPFDVPDGLDRFEFRGSGLPRLARAHLLIGATRVRWQRAPDERSEPLLDNLLLLLSPSLEIEGTARKLHLVPFGEYVPAFVRPILPYLRQIVPRRSTVNADGPVTLVVPPAGGQAGQSPRRDPVRLAPLVCFDALFPELTRAFLQQEPPPDLLVNATNDAWFGYSSGPYQFLDIARLRAIEARRTVLRPAYAGVTAVILPTGELAPGAVDVGPVDPSLAPATDPPGLLVADVPLLGGRTLYARVGDLFGQACAAVAVALLAAAALRGRFGAPEQTRRARASPSTPPVLPVHRRRPATGSSRRVGS